MFGVHALTNIIWPVSGYHMALCAVVTIVMLLLGIMYTYLRQKAVKSADQYPKMSRALEETTDYQWPAGDASSRHEDCRTALARSDPMEYCSHIQSQIKQAKHRIAEHKIEGTMTAKERNEERSIQRRQMEEIFRVMEDQKEQFGVNDVSDLQEQLKMYIQ